MTIGFLLCVAAGFFLQPYASRVVKWLGSIRFRSTPTHLTVEYTSGDYAYCCDCHRVFGAGLKRWPEYGNRQLCYQCVNQRRRESDFDPACDCHECEVIARNRAFVTRRLQGVDCWDN